MTAPRAAGDERGPSSPECPLRPQAPPWQLRSFAPVARLCQASKSLPHAGSQLLPKATSRRRAPASPSPCPPTWGRVPRPGRTQHPPPWVGGSPDATGVSCPQPPAPPPPPKRPRAACAPAPSLDAASPGRLRARPRPAPPRPGSQQARGVFPLMFTTRTPRQPARRVDPLKTTICVHPGRLPATPFGEAEGLCGSLAQNLLSLPAPCCLAHGGRAHMGGIRLTYGGRAAACAATLPGTPNPQILPTRDLGRGFPCCPLCLATPTRLSPPLRLRTQPHPASSGEPPPR